MGVGDHGARMARGDSASKFGKRARIVVYMSLNMHSGPFYATLLGLLCLVLGCGSDQREVDLPPAFETASVEGQVEAFCGDCHATPRPEHFPRNLWLMMVSQGYQFYFESGRDDLTMPPMHEVVEFYRRQAPTRLEMPVAPADARQAPVQFKRSSVDIGQPPTPIFSVAFMNWFPVSVGGPARLFLSDMRNGGLYIADPSLAETTMIQLANPVRVEPCDLDGDGIRDLIVADLGGYVPGDYQNGRVIWVRGNGAGLDEPVALVKDIGRVADVRAGDFDNDGDQDLIVAEFGWRVTGRLFLLINRGSKSGKLQFVRQRVDSRHGTIHVPPIDLDGDGRLDFVALISQEHEVVEAFLNTGHEVAPPGVRFERRIIFEAGNPAFGSNGIELVDLDRDGDIDVLLTNGDIFDVTMPRPYHGIHWLENRGEFPFTHHWITAMPGVHRALAGDFDRDGDLDIAAVALLPTELSFTPEQNEYDSVIWLEQTAPGTFQRHSLEAGCCWHAALELADLDKDGDLDLAVGNFLLDHNDPTLPWASIWHNQLSESKP